ncbi:MAG: YihY/virulence factor BrkB family protein, partial [Muribaculaceae bacterium]|nr:YihY/virulence factor BrkB family protein [Muribaculaceae bacterium]
FYEYCTTGVWKSSDNSIKVRIIKTINLSVRSFLDRDLQLQASALTYSTVLAIVPAFALLFAIGRGFGFQNLLEDQLYAFLPAQRTAITTSLKFVDSYLAASSQGVFVGVGLILLLWTLISLLSNIESSFNRLWDVKYDRSFYQKITDYIAICLIIPVLMICSSGVQIFMSTVIQTRLHLPFLTPLLNSALELAPLALTWLAFTLSFYLIPNTKVKFKYAAISGALCAISFSIVELLFVNGQIYVTKFNAIYGSFAFLPLLLVWLQLSWLILLLGCVLTYSMQNVFAYNFLGDVKEVSADYLRKVALVTMTSITQRFIRHEAPMTKTEISVTYDLPIRLVSTIVDKMKAAGLLYKVVINENSFGYSPAYNCDTFSASDLFLAIDKIGRDDFIPHFNHTFSSIVKETDRWNLNAWADAKGTLLKDINLPKSGK